MQYHYLPFGLKGGPSCCVCLLNHILSDLDFVQCYVDNLIVFSPDYTVHLRHLCQLFERLRMHGITLGLSKCCFLTPEITYLGYVITREGLKPDPRKVSAVAEWPIPSDVRQVQSFLGLANYYRTFIPKYAAIAHPLHDLTCKDTHWDEETWTNECQVAFDALKMALTTHPVRAYPDFQQPFYIYCDACGHSIGAVLAQ